ncbi:hypothetical protein [Mycolicibacterium canariasense]|nr:hypothetical protein [Mycolicibacterium canariasense]
MTYCTCGHADIVHVDSFIHGYQECDVEGCDCTQFTERPAL